MWWRLVRRRMSALCLTSDLFTVLPCGCFKSAWMSNYTPPSPRRVPPLLSSSSHALSTVSGQSSAGLCTSAPGTRSLIPDRRCCVSLHEFRTAEGEGVTRKCTFLLKKKKKKKVLKKTFMGTLLVRERSLVRVAKKQWRTEGEAVWDENSWMYQCFTVSWQPSLLWL